MECRIDPKLLINVIKRYPSLYDRKAPAVKQERWKIWQAVCREIIPNWDQLDKPGKQIRVFSAQKRWKNLRTCYRREVAQQRLRQHTNQQQSGKKVYHYYKYMKFLDDEEDEGEGKAEEEDISVESSESLCGMKYEDIYETPQMTEFEEDHNSKVEFVELQTRENMKVEELNSHVNMKIEDDITFRVEEDGDRQFLMSLIPTFRKFNDVQRFEARIEVLKVLKEITFRSGAGPSS